MLEIKFSGQAGGNAAAVFVLYLGAAAKEQALHLRAGLNQGGLVDGGADGGYPRVLGETFKSGVVYLYASVVAEPYLGIIL